MAVSPGEPVDDRDVSPDEMLRRLGTDATDGLPVEEVARRLAADGRNALSAPPAVPAWRRLLADLRDPLVLLLLAAATLAVLAWLAEGRRGWPLDALAILLIVAANLLIGDRQRARADRAMQALARASVQHCRVVRGGAVRTVPVEELVVGDLLLLAEGDAVGADARLVESMSLRAQEAALTGESAPVSKRPGAVARDAALGDRSDTVFRGTAIVQGSGRAVVVATGMATQIGAIAGMLSTEEEPPSPLQRDLAVLSRRLGAGVGGVAVAVVAALLAIDGVSGFGQLVSTVMLGVSLAVAAVPEGLPAIMTLVLALGMQRLAARRAIVRKLSAVETLGCATVIASDKTGTLTRAEMTIERITTMSGTTRVTGVGHGAQGRIEFEGRPLESGALRTEQQVVVSGGSLAGNAQWSVGRDGVRFSGDPTEIAFLVAEHKAGASERRRGRFERLAQNVFTSERKMMSTVERDHEHGDRPVLVAKGAPDVLLTRCATVRVGGDVVPLDAGARRRFADAVAQMSDAALRTLAVAYRPLSDDETADDGEALEHDLIFVGVVGMHDPPRESSRDAIVLARRAGIRVVMITGDHPGTARRVAIDLGLVDVRPDVLSGGDIDRLDEHELAQAVRRATVYARVSPQHKLRIVRALQAAGDVVAMTGDGVNDAPALKAADIGVAMGSGTEVARQAARIVLADDDFATIVEAVHEGRAIYDNLCKFLRYLLSSNAGEVLTVFGGIVAAPLFGLTGAGGMLIAPLLTTQILWINLVTDSAPALALGVDPPAGDLMDRPPRAPGQAIVDGAMLAYVVGTGAAMALLTLLTLDALLPGGLIDGTSDAATGRTAAFTVLVFAQLLNCLNARSDSRSIVAGLWCNRWLWAAITLSVVLQVAVVHVGVFNELLGTVPLSAGQWGLCVAAAAGIVVYAEIVKGVRALARRVRRGRAGEHVNRL